MRQLTVFAGRRFLPFLLLGLLAFGAGAFARLSLHTPNLEATLPPGISPLPCMDRKDTIGFYRPSDHLFYLRGLNNAGYAHATFKFGDALSTHALKPVIGDWNGDRIKSVGYYDTTDRKFHFTNGQFGSPTVSWSKTVSLAGASSMIGFAGDWNGDGTDTVGLLNPSTLDVYLFTNNTSAVAAGTSPTFNISSWGTSADEPFPLAGDWDGNGTDTIGIFFQKTSIWKMSNANSNAAPTKNFGWGVAGSTPRDRALVGDWDGNGSDSIGMLIGGGVTYYLANSLPPETNFIIFGYGDVGQSAWPVAGDWCLKQCSNGLDDDADGKTDHPNDPSCASADANDEGAALLSSASSSVGILSANPDPAVTKTGPVSVVRGGTATYTVRVDNLGNATANGIVVSDAVPSGFSFNSGLSSTSCTLNGSTVQCGPFSLSAAALRSFTVAFNVNSTACASTATNTATVTSTTIDASTANNTSTATTSVVCPASSSSSSLSSGSSSSWSLIIDSCSLPVCTSFCRTVSGVTSCKKLCSTFPPPTPWSLLCEAPQKLTGFTCSFDTSPGDCTFTCE